MPISRKLIAAVTVNILTVVIAYAVTKLGLHETVGDAALISGVIGQASGAFAGWLVREVDPAKPAVR